MTNMSKYIIFLAIMLGSLPFQSFGQDLLQSIILTSTWKNRIFLAIMFDILSYNVRLPGFSILSISSSEDNCDKHKHYILSCNVGEPAILTIPGSSSEAN